MREGGRARGAIVAALWLAVVPAIAAAEMESLTFDEAVRRAIEQNRDVALAATAILGAEARLGQARSVFMPTVELTAVETVIDDDRGFGDSVVAPRDQLAFGATATVPLLAASAWAARVQARDQVTVAELETDDVRRMIAVATAHAYLAVIAAHRQVDVDERALENARAQLDYAQARFEGGGGSRLNAVRAAEVVATDEVLVERSRFALRLGQEALGLLVVADRPVDAAGEPTFVVPPEEGEPGLEGRTDLRLAAARRDAADRVLRDSWKDWLPTIDARFTPLWVEPAGAFEEDATWRATIGARFPLYLGGERSSVRAERHADLQSARIDLDRIELEARAEVRVARAAVAAAERGVASARTASVHAAEVLKITEIAFRAGATTNIELIDAQRRARDSESAATLAEDLLRQWRLDLLAALGLFPELPPPD